MKRKGQAFNGLVFVLSFWTIVMILMTFFGQYIIESSEDAYSTLGTKEKPTLLSGFGVLWKIMIFDVTGVSWFVSMIVDLIALISIAIVIFTLRGVS